jgi:hypothetical protein
MSRPKVILVMRHAEKPKDPVDPTERKDPGLTPEGVAHAERLVSYIHGILKAPPDFIFAAEDSDSSWRPRLTVTPLKDASPKAVFDDKIKDDDFPKLVARLLGEDCADKLVVVCWHHGNIPGIMEKLGADRGYYAKPWPDKVFNLVMKVEYPNGKCKVTWLAKDFSTRDDAP